MGKISISDELKMVIDDIAEIAQYAWERGWAARNWGNMSVDVTALITQRLGDLDQFHKIPVKLSQSELSGRYFLIKEAGSRFRDLARQPERNLLLIRISDKLDSYSILWGGEGINSRPTSEFIPHMKVHAFLRRNSSPEKAVLHTHTTRLIALTHIQDYGIDKFNRFLWSTQVGVKVYVPEGVGMAPYYRGGSEELANATVSLLKNHRVVLWEKHGCIATGTDIGEAFDIIDILDKAAEIFLICRSAGYELKPLTNK